MLATVSTPPVSGFQTSRKTPVPYVVISNSDIVPFPLHLGRFAQHTNRHADFLVVDRFCAFACFAYTLRGHRELGYFDETIFPAYGEDVEIHLRAVSKRLGLQNGPFGNWEKSEGREKAALHYISPNIAHDSDASKGVGRFPLEAYILLKWGVNKSGVADYQFEKPFLHPFNRSRILHNNSWIVDPEQRACLMGLKEGRGAQCTFNQTLLKTLEV